MKSNQFESACEDALGDWLWNDNFSRNYTIGVSLNVYEMRQIANYLRQKDGRTVQLPREFSELEAEKSKL